MKIVLDTAALITAFRSGTGAAAEVVRLVLTGKLTLLMDFKLVCEYRDVAMRPEQILISGRTPEDTEFVIAALEQIASPVFVERQYRPLSRDANDDMVLDVAINGQADAIITNNIKDLSPAVKFGIRVLTPREFLVLLRNEEPHHASKTE